MFGWQIALVILAPIVGAIVGGLMGWVRSGDDDFEVKRLIQTVFTGLIAGGLWLGAVDWSNAQFGPAIIIAGLFIGAGVDYSAKKTVLT